MTDPYKVSDTLFEAKTKLTPRNAVAAIILDENQRLLLQLRDDKETIFFPNHWGCFGGALEPGETGRQALLRELKEELGMAFDAMPIAPFITISFHATAEAKTLVDRHFFVVHTRVSALQQVQVHEGKYAEWLSYRQCMQLPNVTPYDKFGIWLYFSQPRISG